LYTRGVYAWTRRAEEVRERRPREDLRVHATTREVAFACLGLGAGLLGSSWRYLQAEEEETNTFDAYFLSRPATKVSGSVVNIAFSNASRAQGGSGFIIDGKEGLIVTNQHVVESPSSRVWGRGRASKRDGGLTITLQDGRKFQGHVINGDPETDLAIVKLEDLNEVLPQVTLGDSRSIQLGEWVLALGSPLLLKNTVTAGIVSCVERKRGELGIPLSRTDYIQTDAAINVGNSGGPLVNLRGEVIGINTIKALSANNIAFAIPVETAKFVIKQILRHGRVVRPFIGIKMLDLTGSTISALRERDPRFPKVESGVFVPSVTPGSPAETAGFLHGDVIVEFDHRKVSKGQQILDLLGEEVGKRHQVVVVREHGEKKVLYVTSEESMS